MTVPKLIPKCIIFGGCLCPKAVQTTLAFHLNGEHTLYVDVKEESERWLEQTRLAVGTHCLGKDTGISASRIMLGQFSYMLFASLKSLKSCHVKLIPLALC